MSQRTENNKNKNDNFVQQPRIHEQRHRHFSETFVEMEGIDLQNGLEGTAHLHGPLCIVITRLQIGFGR